MTIGRFVLLPILSIILLTEPLFASPTIRHRAVDESAQDLATLVGTDAKIDIRTEGEEGQPNHQTSIKVSSEDGSVQYELCITFGVLGSLGEVPMKLAVGSHTMGLGPKWGNWMAEYPGKDLTSAEIVGRLQDEIVSFVRFAIFQDRRDKAEAAHTLQKRQEYTEFRRRERLADRLGYTIAIAGAGLGVFGLYDLVYTQSIVYSTHPMVKTFAGVGLLTSYVISALPVLLGENESLIHKLINRVLDRRGDKAIEKEIVRKSAEMKAEWNRIRSETPQKFDLGTASVQVHLGSLTEVEADAYIVPQFATAAAGGGVSGALMDEGGEVVVRAIENYGRLAKSEGPFPAGKVIMNAIDGSNLKAKRLYNVSSVNYSGRENDKNPARAKRIEFAAIQRAYQNVLSTALADGMRKVAIPVLGTGEMGHISLKESLLALRGALASLSAPIDITIALWDRPTKHAEAIGILESLSQAYEAPQTLLARPHDNCELFLSGAARAQ